jgi:Flp pilus assembly protein TadD
MCRKLALTATAIALAAAFPALARDKPAEPAAAAGALVKATAEARAMADRDEPVARAAFWAREVQVDPSDVDAGIRFAAALRAVGQNGEAALQAERVSVIDPTNVEALLEIARAHIAAKEGFLAIAPAQKAHGLNSRDWRAPSLLGVALEQVGRNAEALAAYQTALTLAPNNASVLSNLGLYYLNTGDKAGAETWLRRAAAAPGSTIQIRQNLAYALGLAGKLAEAEALMRQDLPPEQVAGNLAYLKAQSPTP